jgi:hypothetical protein
LIQIIKRRKNAQNCHVVTGRQPTKQHKGEHCYLKKKTKSWRGFLQIFTAELNTCHLRSSLSTRLSSLAVWEPPPDTMRLLEDFSTVQARPPRGRVNDGSCVTAPAQKKVYEQQCRPARSPRGDVNASNSVTVPAQKKLSNQQGRPGHLEEMSMLAILLLRLRRRN